jgi:hypothetical protein
MPDNGPHPTPDIERWPWWRVACGVFLIAAGPGVTIATDGPDWAVAAMAVLMMTLVLGLVAIVERLEAIARALRDAS